MNIGNMNKKIDKNERVVAVWYVLLAALEDVETQRRGFCFLVNPKTATIRQVKVQPVASETHVCCVDPYIWLLLTFIPTLILPHNPRRQKPS